MKKILLSLLTFIIVTGLAAQPMVYTPALKSPENLADKQMPDVTVSWYAIAGSLNLKYQLQIDTTANFNSPLKISVVQTLITGYQTNKLLFGTTYYWRVRAIDGDTSYWSEIWNFKVFSQMELTKPADGAENQEANAELGWKSTINNVTITGVSQFDYQIDTSQNFDSPLFQGGTVASNVFTHKNTSLRFGTVYYWRVRAKHTNSTSDWTTPFSFTVLDKLTLQLPANNAVNQMLDLNLKWKIVGGAVSYGYQIASDEAFTNLVFEAETDTNIVKASFLQFGIKYYWRVRARHMTDTTGWGTPNNFTTINTVILKSPADLEQGVVTQPAMQWTSQTGNVGFQLQIGTDNGFATPFINVLPDAGTTSYQVLKTLASQTTYYWRMRSFSNGGVLADTTAWSTIWSFKTGFGTGIDDPSGNAFSIYPNPAGIMTYLRVNLTESATVSFAVVDLVGKTVLQSVFDLKAGNNVQEVSLGDLKKGIYIVRLTLNGRTLNQKLIKE
jgi:hypothetical protein